MIRRFQNLALPGLSAEYLDDFKAPYVASSPIKLGCKYLNEYLITENDTLLIIGAIEHIYIKDEAIANDGWIQLDKAETAACIGLDGYALPELLARFSYAQPDKELKNITD